MNKKEIAPGIVVYSDVIPDSESLYLDIEEGIISANLSWSAASVKEGPEAGVNTKTRDTQTIGVGYFGEVKDTSLINNMSDLFFTNLSNIFFKNFDPVEKDYMSYYGIFSEWHDSYGVLKYGEGQQFTNHIDDHPSYHRRVSTVYYLNNNYKGGEINFPRFDITFKPEANQMIVFPSTYVYNHSVSPVTEGERYAVVSWLK
jgi:hypothetical protein